MTTVADVMTRDVRTMKPSDSVVDAARCMDELNVGVIPVCDGEKLVGIVTDRDIVVRGLAQKGEVQGMKLADVMSGSVRCAKEGDDIDQVLGEMAEAQIRRLPVVDANQKLVGIVTLGDIAAKGPNEERDVGSSLGDISSPAEPDRSETGNGQSQSQSQSQGQGRIKH
ncbi:CBS domain-containing protein [Ramlibacter montanisoli]|uniref:CBS domain-containing protein n=1 Tax=Ramlibacter montanisoli TaxID=2732512 RepID=A0A849KL48_9BURK|nr:CBS domain-containing protein [Ramlibacter montanisoli]NNU45171.1 CBS domain-containing protein [Ramlibacter montanisoli]